MFSIPITLQSHPVIWKGGQVLSVTQDSFQRKLAYHYSVSRQFSFGAHYMSVDENLNQDYTLAQSNILLKRWNRSGSQGNVYALLSLGQARDLKKPAMHLGLQGDWETRRVYTFLKADYPLIVIIYKFVIL